MEGGAAAMAVTAATGALGPVLAKLRALLSGGNSILDGRRETGEILSIKSELEAVFPLFVTLPEAEEDPGAATASKDWMGDARELFYDIEDAVEDYLLDLESRGISYPQVVTARNPTVPDFRFLNLFRDFKMKLKEVKRRCSERMLTPEANKMPTVVDPRARFLHRDASEAELVGMERQKAKVMELLLAGDDIEGSSASHQKLRMVWIVGFAGMGKTTLANVVYQTMGEQFQCRAFASLSPPSSSSSTMGFLNDILRQITDSTSVPSEDTEVATKQYLIDHISSALADKRYLVIVELPWESCLFSNSVHVLAGDRNCPRLVKFSNGLPAVWMAWKNGTISSSTQAMCRQDLSIMLFDHFGSSSAPLPVLGLKVTSIHTNIPQWVKEHLTDVSSFDIRICRLEEEDLKFLRQMPNLQVLALRLQILPREPISVTAEGFSKLESFLVDCRLPLVNFKQGAMPNLKHLEFKFYTGRASVHPMSMGITNLQSIEKVVFWCSKYYTSDCLGIAGMLKILREEAMEHPRQISIWINDNEEIFPENKGSELCEENSINAAGSRSDCGIKTMFAASAINHKGKATQMSDSGIASCSHEIQEAQE